MRVRNTHPNRPLMCSGLHLQPGVWTEVSESFVLQHGGVPDLEFEAPESPSAQEPYVHTMAPGIGAEYTITDHYDAPPLAATLPAEPLTQSTGRPEPDEEPADAANGQAAPPPPREWAQENGWPELKDGRRKMPPEAQAAYDAAFPA